MKQQITHWKTMLILASVALGGLTLTYEAKAERGSIDTKSEASVLLIVQSTAIPEIRL